MGVPFDQIYEMNIAIKQRDLSPYVAHRKRLDEILWPGDREPKTIIDLGAGYGAMAMLWPEGSTVYNVDLPVMLSIQESYCRSVRAKYKEQHFVPITETDSIPLDGAYLFSVWALTETTMDTWRYWIERAPRLRGAYILGFESWVDENLPWPWMEMAMQFKELRVLRPVDPNSMELAGVNT